MSLFRFCPAGACALLGFFLTFLNLQTAHAVPALQLYIEGATYDVSDETWRITAPAGDPLRLWAVGNVAGPGGKGSLLDVRAAFSYESSLGGVTLDLSPTTTGSFGGFADPSLSASPTLLATYTDGSAPVMANGHSLASHGIYGVGTTWQEWALGDLTLTDSPIADFANAFPAAPVDATGQINAYEITVTGLGTGDWLHVDLYGSYLANAGKVKTTFAPFSHDAAFAQGGAVQLPVPGAALLFVTGVLLFAGLHLRGWRRTA